MGCFRDSDVLLCLLKTASPSKGTVLYRSLTVFLLLLFFLEFMVQFWLKMITFQWLLMLHLNWIFFFVSWKCNFKTQCHMQQNVWNSLRTGLTVWVMPEQESLLWVCHSASSPESPVPLGCGRCCRDVPGTRIGRLAGRNCDVTPSYIIRETSFASGRTVRRSAHCHPSSSENWAVI